MFLSVGKLVNLEHQLVGSTLFSVVDLEIDVNGKPLAFTAKFDTADKVQALLEGAPEGCLIHVSAKPEFRVSSSNGVAYMDMSIQDVQLLGSIGESYADFRLQGFVEGVEEVLKKDGTTFLKAIFRSIAFGRDGYIDNAYIDISLNADDLPIWQANEGKLALLHGNISGYKSVNPTTGKARVWPRFHATQMNLSPVPLWLAPLAPATPAPATPTTPPAAAPAAGDDFLGL